MAVKTIELAPGMEIDIEEFTKAENEIFDRDYTKLIAHYTRFCVDKDSKHVIFDALTETKDVFRLIGQAAKKAIQPSAGVFQGMRALTGFGMTMIRPAHITPNVQGSPPAAQFQPTFDATCLGNANEWMGLYHNGVIGSANVAAGQGWNGTPLYLRKELALGIVGVMELDPTSKIEEVQFEINGKPLPVYNMLTQMRGTDVQFFRFPTAEYLKPAVQYRSHAKYGAVGTTCPVPVGVAFVISDWLRQPLVPNRPAVTAP